MEKMVGKLGKTNLMKDDSVLKKQMQRNPNHVMQQLAKSMDPKMLKQMGGAQSMMNMMKQMGGADMGELQKMMGGMMGGRGGLGGGRKVFRRRR